MFTLNDLKNPTINITQIYSDKIKVYDEIIETFPFNFIAIHLNKITNKLSLDIKNSNETWRKILTVDVSPELAESFKAYSNFIKNSLNKNSLTEDEIGLYNVFGLNLELHQISSSEQIALAVFDIEHSIFFHIKHYDDYVNIDELLQIILKRISSFK